MDTKTMKSYMPETIECVAGEVYSWCGCGQSHDRLFTDAKCTSQCHSIDYVASSDELVTFCRCKATKTPPFCDGSHGQVILSLSKQKS